MIGAIPKNDREKVIVSLGDFKGHAFIDVRLHYTKDEGATFAPTPKGVTVKPGQVAELIRLLQLAQTEADKRGLIGGAQ